MTEYIERGALMKEIQKHTETIGVNAERLVARFPAADVEPVVHAHWSPDNMDACCSNCFAPKPRDEYGTIISAEYCYACGAHMDERSEPR